MGTRDLLLLAWLPAFFGSGPAWAEGPGQKGAPTASVSQRDGLSFVSLGGPRPTYLIDPRTETCALLGPGGAMLAVDCGKLARSVPQTRQVITWTGTADSSPAWSASPPRPPSTITEQELAQGIRCGDKGCLLRRSLLDKLLEDNTHLATSARFVPSIQDGQTNGFKVYAIRPGSVFQRMGMENGDRIKAINGLEMNNPEQALSAYSKLKSATELVIAVERRGQSVTLSYQIQ